MSLDAIEISGDGFRYSAFVGRGLRAQAGRLARDIIPRSRCAVLTDPNVPARLVDDVIQSFTSSGFEVMKIVVPAGEKSKSLAQVEKNCTEMIAAGLDRSSFVIGVGGGVVGDLSGFVAAVFQRGIPHLQMPTTLLAMVDSSIGGKTGVNLEAGKNLVGAIHHPALVIADVEALESLPTRELRQGYAEIIKHAIIRDAEMFREVAQVFTLRADKDASLKFAPLIQRNIAIKARIVSADDRETSGERALLNFGHTVGHAIERAADFKIPHGDCVSLGMVAACNISVKRAGLSAKERDEVVMLLKQFDLSTQLPAAIDRKKVTDAIMRDKKFVGGEIRFVVTPKIGSARVSRDVTMKDIRDALEEL